MGFPMKTTEMGLNRLEKIENFVQLLSRSMEWIGLTAVLVMMFITFFDVIFAKIFVRPIPGSIDIVMLSQLIAIAFVSPLAELIGSHIKVDFFIIFLPKRFQATVGGIIYLLLIVFFALIVWRLYVFGNSLRISHQVSSAAEITLYPFAYGAAAAMVVVCFVLTLEFMKNVLEVLRQ